MEEKDIIPGLAFRTPYPPEGDGLVYKVKRVDNRGVYLTCPEVPSYEGKYPYDLGEVLHYLTTGRWKLHTPQKPLVNLFSTQEHNVVMTALEECAKDNSLDSKETYFDLSEAIDHFLESTPKTSLVAELTDKIYELGFQITPKP